jgi:predicted DsbA family dithiol-disulfide isomerase
MPLTIDLWTDIVCPWCFIGVERLGNVLAGTSADVQVRHHPFQLDPSTPAEGRNIREWLEKRYGRDPAPMWKTVEAAAAESGLALDLSRQPMAYPTLAAHTVIAHAPTPRDSHALARALFRAYFIDAKNIADPSVLAAIAEPHGIPADLATTLATSPEDLDATRTQVAQARRLGIQGVPYFLFDERLAVSGAQPEAILRRAIEQAGA